MRQAILSAFLCALVLKTFFFDFILTQGRSMTPTLKSGSVLMVNKLAYGLRLPFAQRYALRWAAPREGDVIVFWTPYGDLAVKRCAHSFESGVFSALGDNRAASFDSRAYGPVPADNIVGKALGVK